MINEAPLEGYLFTGIRELDKRLGLGIPVGTLGLIEANQMLARASSVSISPMARYV